MTTTTDYLAWAERVRRLDRALEALEPAARRLGCAPPAGEEWFELIRHKLIPQVEGPPLLVVSVVGGTNIGKSMLFNHLAGEVASAVSPLAAGTKHPVCLVPEGLDDEAELRRIFEDFQLHRWSTAEDPLVESGTDLLFWRVGRNVPQRLLLLDAPDIDSDAAVNWRRARALRQVSDVLIAVLTQQKYNDAAVKQFFREAADADKPFIIVFNQCDLAFDRGYWPQWLRTFTEETGTRPELVYVVPYDRAAADRLGLPFFCVGPEAAAPPEHPASLREELAALHFDAIKIRTFRGAVARVLDPQRGLEGYLGRLREAAAEFSAAGATLSAREMARVDWPTLPAAILVEEIRSWWDAGRRGWSRAVHGVYRKVGRGVLWPFRQLRIQLGEPPQDPRESMADAERRAVVAAVGGLFDELARLARVGNETLRPRLARLLGGNARQEVLERVQQAHAELEAVDDDYRRFLCHQLDDFREHHPRAIWWFHRLDEVGAVARPAITVSLGLAGWDVAADLAGQAAAQAVITGGITAGGETVLSGGSEGAMAAVGRLFRGLQAGYARHRAAWLAGWLERELLGDLLGDLRGGAEVPAGEAFAEVEAALEEIKQHR